MCRESEQYLLKVNNLKCLYNYLKNIKTPKEEIYNVVCEILHKGRVEVYVIVLHEVYHTYK